MSAKRFGKAKKDLRTSLKVHSTSTVNMEIFATVSPFFVLFIRPVNRSTLRRHIDASRASSPSPSSSTMTLEVSACLSDYSNPYQRAR